MYCWVYEGNQCLWYRSSHQRCSLKKDVLKNFPKFTGKHLCLKACNFIKKEIHYSCFSVCFVKFLWIVFWQNNSWRLLLMVLPEVFYKKDVLKNFAKFKEKHSARVSFLITLQAETEITVFLALLQCRNLESPRYVLLQNTNSLEVWVC